MAARTKDDPSCSAWSRSFSNSWNRRQSDTANTIISAAPSELITNGPSSRLRRRFLGANGETKEDELLWSDYRKIEFCFRINRIANHPKKELYLKELHANEGLLEMRDMLLRKLAINENTFKGLDYGTVGSDYINGVRRPECSKWRQSRVCSRSTEEEFEKSRREVVEALKMLQ
jgi:hypothetical protein